MSTTPNVGSSEGLSPARLDLQKSLAAELTHADVMSASGHTRRHLSPRGMGWTGLADLLDTFVSYSQIGWGNLREQFVHGLPWLHYIRVRQSLVYAVDSNPTGHTMTGIRNGIRQQRSHCRECRRKPTFCLRLRHSVQDRDGLSGLRRDEGDVLSSRCSPWPPDMSKLFPPPTQHWKARSSQAEVLILLECNDSVPKVGARVLYTPGDKLALLGTDRQWVCATPIGSARSRACGAASPG